jgi:hypothetical protein
MHTYPAATTQVPAACTAAPEITARLVRALRSAYALRATTHSELAHATRAYVAHLKAIGVTPREALAALERLAFHTAPPHAYWEAYGRLSSDLAQWGHATYHAAS